MRCLTFSHDRKEQIGILTEDGKKILPISAVLSLPASMTMTEFIAQRSEEQMRRLQAACKDPSVAASYGWEEIEPASPIPRPIHDVVCVGVNYLDHSKEINSGKDVISIRRENHIIYFGKRASRILGDKGTVYPPFSLDKKTDYETELAVIIGKKGRDIPRSSAEDYIFGYSILNDLSSRGLQNEHKQWMKGKSLDGFTAMGPWIVTKDEIPLPLSLKLTTKVNGELRQSSNTDCMISDVNEIISDFSAGITLEPGDIIATGTPAGVALGMEMPEYLKSGDEVVSEIEGIGTLKLYIR